jgi:hypothetical protein
MMAVEPIGPEDLPEIASWRSGGVMPWEQLPPVGFMVRGVAAGWLIQTDTAMALLEHFVSNPLESICIALVHEARGLGFSHVVVLPSDRSIERRVRRLGFEVAGRGAILAREAC